MILVRTPDTQRMATIQCRATCRRHMVTSCRVMCKRQALVAVAASSLPPVPAAVEVSGHRGLHRALMGVYDHSGDHQGMPCFKARRRLPGHRKIRDHEHL